MTLIQPPNLVYRIFNLLIYSLGITIEILVSNVVLLDIITPAPGLIKPIGELPIVEPVPTCIPMIINNTFFLFKHSHFLLYYSLSISRGF